jgi:hypothetical protein
MPRRQPKPPPKLERDREMPERVREFLEWWRQPFSRAAFIVMCDLMLERRAAIAERDRARAGLAKRDAKEKNR